MLDLATGLALGSIASILAALAAARALREARKAAERVSIPVPVREDE